MGAAASQGLVLLVGSAGAQVSPPLAAELFPQPLSPGGLLSPTQTPQRPPPETLLISSNIPTTFTPK